MKHKTIHRGARGLLLALSLLAIAAFAHGAGQPTARSAWATMHPAFHSAGAQFKGAASASAPLSIVVSLKLNNKDALDRYILAQHTPGNPAYRHWLSHAESTSMFGPTQAQAQAVADYLTQSGFTQVQISPSRLLVSADGTVALAQRAFNTQIGLYSLGGNSGLANTTAIQVPAGLTQIDHVLGLDTVTRVHTHLMRSSSPMPVQGTTSSGSNANAVKSGQRSGAVNQPAMGTGNGDGYYPEGFATVYNAGGLTAASTTVAVIGWGDMTNPEIDLQQLATRLGTAVTTSIVYPPAVSNGNDDSGQSEWAMDAQAIVGIAGSVNELIFYSSGGRYVDSTNTPCVTYDPANCGSTGAYSDQLLLAIAQAVSDNKATVINMSWGAGECGNPANVGWADSAFALGTIQGQTFAASTGDNGSYPCAAVGGNGSYGDQTQPSTEYPSTSPYVVAVGGTTLTTTQTGATSNYYDYSLETGWAYSGGGVSAYVSAPSWQSSLSGTNRQVPDVAFNGDPDTGIIIYLTKSDTADIAQDGWGSGPVSGPGYYTNGGTSLSSPLFVGAWAVLQSANGNNLGFAAPALYAHALAGSPPPPPSPPPFHDVPMGGTGDGGTVADSNGGNGTYVSKSGYDNVTGWGSFDITKMLTSTITQTITFTSTAPVNPVVGSTYTVTATGGASGNPVVFSIDGTSTAGACTVVGSLVTFTGVGTCIIDANQAGDGTYTAATQKQQTINVISPTPQTITFTSTAPVNPVVGSTYTVTATGGTSGNPVTFTIDGASTAGACTLTGSVVTFTGGGTCIIDANQAGNATYAAAPQAQQTINILGVQTITFTSTAPVNPAVGSTYTVTATGGASGNPVTLTIDGTSTAGACTLAGSVVTFNLAGATCVIDANQAGNATYAAAPQAQQTIVIGGGGVTPQTITFTSTAPVNPAVGSTYTVTATGGASGNPVTFTIDGTSTAGACTLTGSVVTFTGVGTCIIDANQAGSATYAAAKQAQQTIVIGGGGLTPQTITFTSTAPVNPTVGDTYTAAATASSGLPVEYSIDPNLSAPNICLMVSPPVVIFTGEGNCIINANQPGGTNGGITYAAAAQVQQLVIINLSTPPTPLTPQEITGAWYTPIHNGSGFNITQTDQGLILFYYGWDSSGHRLWLISDIGPRQIVPETSITLNMNQTVGGHFQTPAPPSTLTKWGMLTISFSTGGTTATATLTGKDGTVDLGLQKLAGMASTSSFTGAWYDPAYNGSGFNILIAPQGLVLFYYGWDNDGNRLWLISDIDPAAITPGTPITLNMNQTSGGHFLTPANPSSTLSQWGTLKLDFSSCTKGTGSLTSKDGSSAVTFDNLQMIAGVMNAPGC